MRKSYISSTLPAAATISLIAIGTVTEAANQTELLDDKKQEIQQVLDWTTKYADLLDPLNDLPDSVDEFVHPERKYPWLKEG